MWPLLTRTITGFCVVICLIGTTIYWINLCCKSVCGDGISGLVDYLNQVAFPPLLMDKNANQTPDFNWAPCWLPQGFKAVNRSIERDGDDKIESGNLQLMLLSFTLYVSDKNPRKYTAR